MHRHHARRRSAVISIPLALLALTTTTTLITTQAGAASEARIASSAQRVPIGERVTLRGSFPGASKAPVEVRFRAAGAKTWQTVSHTRTGAAGAYSARVKPRRSGYWSARLANPQLAHSALAEPGTGAAPGAVDGDTGAQRIAVRSRTTAKVEGRNALVGRSVRIHGTVAPATAGRRIVVSIGHHEEKTRTARNGSFSVNWRTPSTGTYPVRVKARRDRLASGSADRAGKVTAFRRAAASWYGPGLYGNALACGGTLTPGTLGVANKTLPCGTKLTLRYGGRSVNVRVIDRGPFSGNREFDLTAATKQRLGFPDTGTILTSR